VPKNAVNLKRMIGAHHGVLIVTPEYNSSVPPLVKNTIDWVSRVQDAHETRGQVFRERAFAIAAASGGRLGGTRALAALRLILSAATPRSFRTSSRCRSRARPMTIWTG
jgi:chromate reductase